jgi:hypothetical protein
MSVAMEPSRDTKQGERARMHAAESMVLRSPGSRHQAMADSMVPSFW